MRGILIDPFARTVTETDWTGELHAAYELVGAHPIDVLSLDPLTELILDDEGLLRERQAFFMWGTYPAFLAGKALVAGTTRDGDWADCQLIVDEVQAQVRWASPLAVLAWMATR